MSGSSKQQAAAAAAAAAAASSSSSKPPPKNPNPNDLRNPNPNPNPDGMSSSPPVLLSGASHLSRQEVLKRRLEHVRQLSRCYRDHYWALMEDLKMQYRDYYWKFGVSPFKQHHHHHHQDQYNNSNPNNNNNNIDFDYEASADNNSNAHAHAHALVVHNNNNNNNNNNANANANAVAGGGGGGGLDFKSNHRCLFVGCKFKAMALTSFCHLHILSDSNQKLYKACTYVIKSAQAGPITCGKPILRSTVPSLCTVHFQKAQKHVNRALKKAGLNVSSSSKLAPKFHVIVAEYVHQIQAKRRAAQLGNTSKPTIIKEETAT